MVSHLCLEGGGVKGIAYAGALRELEENGYITLSELKGVAGSSAGAIAALLISIGYTVDEMEKVLLEMNFNDYTVKKDCCGCGVFYGGWGYYTSSKMYEFIGNLIVNKLGAGTQDITFKELFKKTKVDLVATGTNLSWKRTDYFRKDTFPDMVVRKAVLISSSFPYAFDAVEEEGCIYSDGGLLDNLPLVCFDNDGNGELNENILALKLTTPEEFKRTKTDISSLSKFSTAIIDSMSVEIDRLQDEVVTRTRRGIIQINTKHVDTLDFDMSDETKELLINEGSKAVQLYFKPSSKSTSTDSS